MATDSGVGGSVGDNLTNMAVTQRYFTPSAHKLVEKALAREPQDRPSAEELLHHQFIRQTRRYHETLPQYLYPIAPLNEETDIGTVIVFDDLMLILNNF